MYIQSEDLVSAVARAHGRRFRHVMPANTTIVAGIIGRGLVEMECEAMLENDAAPPLHVSSSS